MSTLLLRLAGPFQSWGTESRFNVRMTDNVPSKSGVIGLLAAALGRRRDEDISDLRRLHFGVRSDWEGTLIRDYHTAKVPKEKNSNVTERYYLADAVFLVGLEAEDLSFLQRLEEALCSPVWSPYLGRRSCPPTQPLVLGIRELTLYEALSQEPWLAAEWQRKKCGDEYPKLSILIDDIGMSGNEVGLTEYRRTIVRDKPISFDQKNRQFEFRMVKDTGPVIDPVVVDPAIGEEQKKP
ncbi:type I-E CRISPR-associated protein Cas5/CasD [bacterium]|nr:type I-E CRISPR-associated protein Cas5/CasD [bacterium]